MAPQNKRNAGPAKVPVAAKKAKVAPALEPEDPMTLQLAPILSALEAGELPADSCEILRAALPHCLADAASDRHSFQTKMLDLAASSLKGLEDAGRAALGDTEAKVSTLRAEGAVAAGEFEVAQRLAVESKAASDGKGMEMEAMKAEVEAAKAEVAEQVKAKDVFFASKATLIVEQEAFQKVVEEMWQPLKASTFTSQQYRKRDKVILELVEKLQPLLLSPSLIEALQPALKMRLDKRSSFAQKTVDFAEEAMGKHTALLAERVAGTGSGEEAATKAVNDAEAKLVEIKTKYAEQDKEYDELQNRWAELETNSDTAKTAAASFERDIEAALEDVASYKAELDASVAVVASFVALRDPSAAPPPAPMEEPEIIIEPIVNMETEAVAVTA